MYETNKAGPLATVTGPLGVADVTQDHTDDQAGKRQASLRAALGKRGFLMHSLPTGGFLIAKWDRWCDAADLNEVDKFLRRVGGAL